MDVHAPHEPVHNWRDFLTHLTIVTIGLFIALTMEAFVETLHHRHLVREARTNIRQELQINHEAAQKDLALVQQNIERQKQNIQNIQALSKQGEKFRGNVSNTMDFDSMEDAAWHTARDTGALGYMSYAEVQRYSDIYSMADLVNQHALQTAEQDFLAAAPFQMGTDPAKLAPEDYKKLLHDNAVVEIELAALVQFIQQYDKVCVEELKK